MNIVHGCVPAANSEQAVHLRARPATLWKAVRESPRQAGFEVRSVQPPGCPILGLRQRLCPSAACPRAADIGGISGPRSLAFLSCESFAYVRAVSHSATAGAQH